jgi:hypothetical protein
MAASGKVLPLLAVAAALAAALLYAAPFSKVSPDIHPSRICAPSCR